MQKKEFNPCGVYAKHIYFDYEDGKTISCVDQLAKAICEVL